MDKKQAEQARITQAIWAQENQSDELKNEKSKMQTTFEHLQQDFHSGYLALASLDEELLYYGGQEHASLQKNAEQRQMFHRYLDQLTEELTEQYNRQIKAIETKTEELYQERQAFIWD